MNDNTNTPQYLRTALFVDFDNIFLGLGGSSSDAAKIFASAPRQWVSWLENHAIDYPGMEQQAVHRRFLVRRCYINPKAFPKSRSFFIRSGFEVVDCPPLTAQGKTSADIHMVMDMLDALDYSTRFDEFVILSGDADFTPVLLRLRKHDRRTVVLAVGPASLAYKSASDHLLDENLFLEKGLGIEELEDSRPSEPRRQIDGNTRNVLQKIATRTEEMVSMMGRVPAAELLRIFKEFPEFTQGEDWLGFFSMRRLTEGVVERSKTLRIVEDDPWWVGAPSMSTSPSKPQAVGGNGDGGSARQPSLQEVSSVVQEAVAMSDAPVILGSLAHKVSEKLGKGVRESGWLGSSSFKALLERLELGSLVLSSAIPGYLYDPKRHTPPVGTKPEGRSKMADIPEIARQVTQLTDLPAFTSKAYAEILGEITKEVRENGYHLTRTSKAVRDRCNGKEIPVARSHSNFILKGIGFTGFDFEAKEKLETTNLGRALLLNTLVLCQRAQLDLTEEDIEALSGWLLGSLDGRGVQGARQAG